MWDTTITHLFERGGPVMWPLLVGSIIGLAIILERACFFLARRLPGGKKFEPNLIAELRKGNLDSAITKSCSSRHPVARIAFIYLNNLTVADTLRQDILRREGSRAMEDVERNLRGLSLIAHISPLMGLLGTVTGLVSSFHVIEQLQGMAQPAQLAGGIWESLLTTVCGLVIAIPCLAAYHLFEQKADRIARHMQFMISELNEVFGKQESDSPVIAAPANDRDLALVQS